jgi:hypothetical protein
VQVVFQNKTQGIRAVFYILILTTSQASFRGLPEGGLLILVVSSE